MHNPSFNIKEQLPKKNLNEFKKKFWGNFPKKDKTVLI